MAAEVKEQVSNEEVKNVEVSNNIPEELSSRRTIEADVEKKNNEFEPPVDYSPQEEVKKEEVKDAEVGEEKKEEPQKEGVKQEKPVEERVKEKIQRRIDKEVAKRKTLEEQLAEANEEIMKLKNASTNQSKDVNTNREPTDAEIRSALIKAKQDGDVEYEVQIIEYMADRKAKRQREEAENIFRKEAEEKRKVAEEQQRDWISLNKDYLKYNDEGKPDYNHELSLTNQNGLLYRTAMALFQDKELSVNYSDSNKIMGFRRAVADAYREIVENNLLESDSPGKEIDSNGSGGVMPKRVRLAEPGSAVSEEPTATSPKLASDRDNVINEIRSRKKFLAAREAKF